MSAFYTPIFERRWVKDTKEANRKHRDRNENRYEPIEDEDSEKSVDGVDVNQD